MTFSDMSEQGVGRGSVLYHCNVPNLKISTASVYFANELSPPATTSADRILRTPGESLAVGIGGIVCSHLLDFSSNVNTSLLRLPLLFFTPPTATRFPFT